MTAAEQVLWDKIEAFQIDDPQIVFTFSTRLERENGWSKLYTLRVIEEYKKFIFLCCITENGVTPSDPVDQAWHLHLTYTKSYWTDLCKNTLQKEIHHNPTKGGKNEAVKFDSFYTGSQNLYLEKFGKQPPEDIWHNNQQRFSDINFQRVNLNKFWLLRKPVFSKRFFIIASLLFSAVVFIQADSNGFNILFGIMLAGVVIASIARIIKGKGPGDSGCATSGCGNDGRHTGDSGCGSGGHHGGDSGCSSGCSGCSGSGCSGCGGGGD